VRKNEQLLIEELRWEKNQPGIIVKLAFGIQGASKELRSLAKVSSTEAVWVSGFINGEGVTHNVLFRLDGDEATGRRVSSLFIDASFWE
jgi:hypothetical protein